MSGQGAFVAKRQNRSRSSSPLPYFRGKGLLEAEIARSSLLYAILRPTVIFGGEDILINNVAWLLRRLPVFAIPGAGDYRPQPIFVEDLAAIAVGAAEKQENIVIDAVGPEVFTFESLIRLIAGKVQSHAKIIHVPPGFALVVSRLIGYVVKDVLLTRDEVEGLMANLLVSDGPPTGPTRLSDWLDRNARTAGTQYAPEVRRYYR